MDWYLSVLKNYANFSGRARRKEYWMFMLFNFLIAIAASFIDKTFAIYSANGVGICAAVYGLLVLVPSVAVTVRRLHDADYSGWWALLMIIPLGNLVLLVFACLKGTTGVNRFGPDPKANVFNGNIFPRI